MAQPEANPRAVAGNNSKVKAGPISADRLKNFIERIERLDEERTAVGGDIRDVYVEAKGVGYDVKTMRKIVAIRKQDAADRAEQETLLDVYKHALGMDRAVAAVQGGASLREAAADHGVSKSALHRRVKAGVPEAGPAKAGTVGEILETSSSPPSDPSDSTAPTAEPVVPTGNEGNGGEPDTIAADLEDLPDFDIAAASEPMSADEIAQLQARQDERTRRAGPQPTVKADDDLELPAFLRRAPVSELT